MRDTSLPVPTTCFDSLPSLLPRRGAQRREKRSSRPRWRARWPTRRTRARAAARHAVHSQVHTVSSRRCRACVAEQGLWGTSAYARGRGRVIRQRECALVRVRTFPSVEQAADDVRAPTGAADAGDAAPPGAGQQHRPDAAEPTSAADAQQPEQSTDRAHGQTSDYGTAAAERTNYAVPARHASAVDLPGHAVDAAPPVAAQGAEAADGGPEGGAASCAGEAPHGAGAGA